MDVLTTAVETLNGVVWGPLMLALILGTGLVLQIGLRFVPLRKLGMAFRMLWEGRGAVRAGSPVGDLSPFNALMTSLSATIGTGNIAGVGTAIFIGGPGALFWMWCTALVGMATKYAEAVCAVRFREVAAGRGWPPCSPCSARWPVSASATRCRPTRSPPSPARSSACLRG
jgi:AGCS family alanine or glycine:cation symporter